MKLINRAVVVVIVSLCRDPEDMGANVSVVKVLMLIMSQELVDITLWDPEDVAVNASEDVGINASVVKVLMMSQELVDVSL